MERIKQILDLKVRAVLKGLIKEVFMVTVKGDMIALVSFAQEHMLPQNSVQCEQSFYMSANITVLFE